MRAALLLVDLWLVFPCTATAFVFVSGSPGHWPFTWHASLASLAALAMRMSARPLAPVLSVLGVSFVLPSLLPGLAHPCFSRSGGLSHQPHRGTLRPFPQTRSSIRGAPAQLLPGQTSENNSKRAYQSTKRHRFDHPVSIIAQYQTHFKPKHIRKTTTF